MNKLREVAGGILDGAASEYLDSNLESFKNVQLYAEAMEIYLTDAEAERVLTACRNWRDRDFDENHLNSSNDYYEIVTDYLNN